MLAKPVEEKLSTGVGRLGTAVAVWPRLGDGGLVNGSSRRGMARNGGQGILPTGVSRVAGWVRASNWNGTADISSSRW